MLGWHTGEMPQHTWSATALIERAASVVHDRHLGDAHMGQVGCALVTDTGHLHLGVCIDVGSGMGFCAEHAAVAAMVTAGESRVASIVAVWKDESGSIHVLPPCGRCREFLRQVDPDNVSCRVLLGPRKAVTLARLLPYHEWFSTTPAVRRLPQPPPAHVT